MLPQTTDINTYISIPPVCTHAPNFVKEISSPLTLTTLFALLFSSSDLYVQPEDGLTGRGRNMYLAETFVHTLTPYILHKYSCVFECHIYMNWST